MQKSDHPVLDRLIDTAREIHVAQHQLAELKERLQQEARAIGDIDRGSTRLDIAAYAYWYLPEVHAEELVLAVTKRRNIHRFLDLVGPIVSNLSCAECGEGLHVTSRTDMKRVLSYQQIDRTRHAGQRIALCGPCHKIQSARQDVERAKQDRKRQLRYAELRAMSYDEYRRTSDWRNQHKNYLRLQLYIHGECAPLTCEACRSSTGELDVYHVSLEHLGHEHSADLIMLCPDCRDALNQRGRLATLWT